LTQGKKYNPAKMKEAINRVRKSDLKLTCDNCDKRKTCNVLCPEMLRYVNQDAVSRRERCLSDLAFDLGA